MRRMLSAEIGKVCRKPLLLALFFGCLILHLGILWYQENTSTEKGYNLRELSEFYRSPTKVENTQMPEQGLENEEKRKQFLMAEERMAHIEEVDGYQDYRTEISRQAQLRMTSPLFADMDAYTYDNLKYTKDAYDRLGNVEVKADFDDGVLLLTENRLIDLFCVLLLMVVVMSLFLEERENGTWFLLKSMRNGHGELIGVKLTALAILTAAVHLFFYGGAALQIRYVIGFGDTNRSLQSVEGFMPCVYDISVKEFLLLFFLMKYLAFLAAGILLALVCMFLRTTVSSALLFLAGLAAEILLWQNITINSWIAPLKEINLAALIFTEHYFCDFYHVNILSLAVSQQICGFFLVTVCLAGGTMTLLWLHEMELFLVVPVRKKGPGKTTEKRSLPMPRHKRAVFAEGFKLFVSGKGGLVLLAFALSCLFVQSAVHYYMSESEYYYREYSLAVEGKLTEEKEAYLEKERKTLEKRSVSEDVSAQEAALSQVKLQYDEMVRQKNSGKEAAYVYLTPWQFLLGKGLTMWDLLKLALCFLGLILLTASCGAVEKRNEMYQLLSLTVLGKKGIVFRKLLLVEMTALLFYAAAFVPGIFQIDKVYGISGGNLPVLAYGVLPVWMQDMSLAGLLAAKFLLLGLLVLAAGGLLLWISEKIRNRILTILAGSVICLLPLAVCGVFI